jgi:hypothetical protein
LLIEGRGGCAIPSLPVKFFRDSDEGNRFTRLSSLPFTLSDVRALLPKPWLFCLGMGDSLVIEVAAVDVLPFDGPEVVDDVVPRFLLKAVIGEPTASASSY